MPQVTSDRHELARRGQAYYDQFLRATLEADHKGEYLVLDVETGDYELDEDEMAAIQRARAKHPRRAFYILRVGYRAAVIAEQGSGTRIQAGAARRGP
jgi:hypothetical protein